MENIYAAEVAALFNNDTVKDGIITNICTDSREAGEGSLFFAIKGERADGHDFVKDVTAKGAFAIVEKDDGFDKNKVIVVKDSVEAMRLLAKWYRKKFDIPVVGITGSVGKTTTKEMVSAVLSYKYNTVKTEGNQNNEIGAPRTLMRIDNSTEAAVVEMGMCGFGEIAALCDAAAPTMGVITNIGVSHLENLGSRENILKAKLELADNLVDKSYLFICKDNDMLSKVSIERLNVITYGLHSADADIKGEISNVTKEGFTLTILWKDKKYNTQIKGNGEHLALDALAAFGVGVHMGMTPEEAAEALTSYKTTGMRQNMIYTGGITLVEDCYNASPDSMLAAMATLKGYPAEGRKYAVLSDMLELGSAEESGHISAGRAASEAADIMLLWGDNKELYKQGAGEAENPAEVIMFNEKHKVTEYLMENLRYGDVVWFKASRGKKLEEISTELYKYLKK